MSQVLETSEYEGFGAALYESWQVQSNTSDDARAFSRLLDEAGARTVLELGAGTGRLLFALRAGGRIADGIDSSATMRTIYESQLAAGSPCDGQYFTGDFRSDMGLEGRRYDAVIASRNTLAHALTEDELEAVLRLTVSHMTPHGVAIIDLDHFDSSMTFAESGSRSVRVGQLEVQFSFRSSFNPRAESVDFSASGTRRWPCARTGKRFVIRSFTRAWQRVTLELAAQRSGLQLESFVDNYGNAREASDAGFRRSRMFVFRRSDWHA